MFKRNPSMKIECLPDGKFLLKTNISKNTDPSRISDFINSLLIRELLPEFMEGLYKSAQKNGAEDIGHEICDNVFDLQKNFILMPVTKGRNPIIKPTNVMKAFGSGATDE